MGIRASARFGVATLVCSASLGQAPPPPVSVSLLRQFDYVESGSTTTMNGVRSLVAAGPDVFAASIKTDYRGQTMVWGTPGPGLSPTLLCRPGAYDAPTANGQVSRQQTYFETGIGAAREGKILYSSIAVSDTSTAAITSGQSRLIDTLWLRTPGVASDGLLLSDGEVSPAPGGFWRALSAPVLSAGGTPFWLGSTSSEPAGWPTDTAIYSGVGAGVRRLLGTSDRIGTYGLRVGEGGFARYAISPDGTQALAITSLEGRIGPPEQSILSFRATDETIHPVILLETGEVVASSWERWEELYFIAVADATECTQGGAWFVAGRVTGNASSRYVLARNGHEVLREDQVVDGHRLVGAPVALAANGTGDWACVWATRAAGAATMPSLFFNGRRVLGAGSLFSWTDPSLQPPAAVSRVVHDLRPVLAIGERKPNRDLDLYVVARERVSGVHRPVEHIVRVTTFAGPMGCCIADVDDGSGTGTSDGGVTIDDLIFFLDMFGLGDVRADVDDGSGTGTPDGGVTIDDLVHYLTRFQAGC